MTITEMLQLVDQLVFKHTGNHLNNLQKNVLEGIWEGQTYAEIAKEFGYNSENHIGNVSRELYKILSEQLGEDVNKSNLSWTIERFANTSSNSLQQVFNSINNGNINLCSHSPQDYYKKTEPDSYNKKYHDLTLAPKIIHFYDRATQLTTLSHWLTHQNTRLISVLGLSGIGKTTLVKQFVDLNKQQFDVVIWKSIKLSPSLDNILTEILTTINTEPIPRDNKLTQFFHILRQKKCLIILDDVQELFIKGEFAGQFQTEYKNYQNLFTMMTDIENTSSFILISQEQCQEMICLDEDLYPIKCLDLEGLDNRAILSKWGLKDEVCWENLINLYEGNPVYLKDIVVLIKNVFGGKVADFLREDSLVVTKDIKSRLTELFQRLSPIEKEIILHLSKFDTPVSREDLRQGLSLSSMDLINGLESLRQRYLLKRIDGEIVLFALSLLVREYLRICC
jgi:NB-ARC domain